MVKVINKSIDERMIQVIPEVSDHYKTLYQ